MNKVFRARLEIAVLFNDLLDVDDADEIKSVETEEGEITVAVHKGSCAVYTDAEAHVDGLVYHFVYKGDKHKKMDNKLLFHTSTAKLADED